MMIQGQAALTIVNFNDHALLTMGLRSRMPDSDKGSKNSLGHRVQLDAWGEGGLRFVSRYIAQPVKKATHKLEVRSLTKVPRPRLTANFSPISLNGLQEAINFQYKSRDSSHRYRDDRILQIFIKINYRIYAQTFCKSH